MLLTDTVPVTTAVTVPVATTIKPVAVAVSPDDAVVNANWETETVPVSSVPMVTVPVTDTTVVAPAGLPTQTGRPVTPLKPEPVVVITIPEIPEMKTVPDTVVNEAKLLIDTVPDATTFSDVAV